LAFVRAWRRFVAFRWADELEHRAAADPTALFELANNQLDIAWYGALAFQTATVLFRALNETAVENQTVSGVQHYLQTTAFDNAIVPGGVVQFNEDGQADNVFEIVQTKVTSALSDGAWAIRATTLFPEAQTSGDFEVKGKWVAELERCGPQFVRHNLRKCTRDSLRQVSFYWVDSRGYPCYDMNTPCSCVVQDSFALPPPIFQDCEYVSLHSSNGVAIVALATFGAATCALCLALLLYHYNHVVMKAGQREFLLLMCLGGLWCNLAAVSFLGPNQERMCVTRVFSLLFSLTLLIGALTVKVYRIYRIWNNSSMRRIVITAKDMFKLLALILLGLIVVFTAWMAVDTPTTISQATQRTSGEVTVTVHVEVCQYSKQVTFPVISVAYILLILLYCNLLSFQGRNSDSKYMESRSIMFASYCMSFIVCLVIVLVATAELPISSAILLITLGLVSTSVMFVSLVLGPKLYFVSRPGIAGARKAIKRRLASSSKATIDEAVKQTQTQTQTQATTSDAARSQSPSGSPGALLDSISYPSFARSAASTSAGDTSEGISFSPDGLGSEPSSRLLQAEEASASLTAA